MAAPLRLACADQVIRCYRFILKGDQTVSSVLLKHAHKNVSYENEEDFFGIIEDGKVPTANTYDSSANNCETLSHAEIKRLTEEPFQRSKKKNHEVRLQMPFGEIRLDKFSKEKNISNLNTESFLKLVHSKSKQLEPDTKTTTYKEIKSEKHSLSSDSLEKEICQKTDTPFQFSPKTTKDSEQRETLAPQTLRTASEDFIENHSFVSVRSSNEKESEILSKNNNDSDNFVDRMYFSSLMVSDQACSVNNKLSPCEESNLSYIDHHFFSRTSEKQISSPVQMDVNLKHYSYEDSESKSHHHNLEEPKTEQEMFEDSSKRNVRPTFSHRHMLTDSRIVVQNKTDTESEISFLDQEISHNFDDFKTAQSYSNRLCSGNSLKTNAAVSEQVNDDLNLIDEQYVLPSQSQKAQSYSNRPSPCSGNSFKTNVTVSGQVTGDLNLNDVHYGMPSQSQKAEHSFILDNMIQQYEVSPNATVKAKKEITASTYKIWKKESLTKEEHNGSTFTTTMNDESEKQKVKNKQKLSLASEKKEGTSETAYEVAMKMRRELAHKIVSVSPEATVKLKDIKKEITATTYKILTKENPTKEEHNGSTFTTTMNDESEKQKVKNKQKLSLALEKKEGTSETAYEVAMKMRRELTHKIVTENSSPQKMKIMKIKEMMPDVDKMPSVEVTKLLANSVIFENDDFVAINKPYGLSSHGGPGVRVSIGQLLEPLARALGERNIGKLHLVHRLDKNTSGIILLAKNAEVAWQLLGMFRRREVIKIYWTITKGVPQPSEGLIDIPLAREKIGGSYRTVVKPEKYVVGGETKSQKWSRRGDHSSEAITEYKVLSDKHGMALVECRPLTGIQHQLRAHLSQAMNTPVLGDHKYSHMDHLAPQRLFPEALQKFQLRQAQVRNLPMYLIAKTIILPEWQGHKNIFIRARLPKYFLHGLKTLQIKIPDM